MWHQGFNRNFTKLWEYFLYAKKTKIMTLFNNSSPPHHCSTILESIHWTQTAYAVLCQPHHTDMFSTFIYALIWTKTAYSCGAADTEQHTLFAYKKYSRSFVELRLNPWCHMDYFTDLFATFLDVDRVNSIVVYGRVRQLSECIKNILYLCSEDVINDKIFILGWSNPLRKICYSCIIAVP